MPLRIQLAGEPTSLFDVLLVCPACGEETLAAETLAQREAAGAMLVARGRCAACAARLVVEVPAREHVSAVRRLMQAGVCAARSAVDVLHVLRGRLADARPLTRRPAP